ncbi:hypothetical protein Tco_1501671 [Tanacetum coccineum]
MTQATIQAGQITTENVQRRALGNKGKQIATGSQGKLVTCYNCRGQEYTKNARRRNGKRTHNGSKIRHCLWKLKRKALFWMQRLKLFLVDVECTTPYVEPLAITTTTAFKVSHEDAYDFDVDEAPHAAATFMANLIGTSTGEGTSNDTDFHSEVESNKSLKTESEKLKTDNKAREDSYQEELVWLRHANKDLHKTALGRSNPKYLKTAQLSRHALYHGDIVVNPLHTPHRVHDNEDTLVHAKVSRTKMLEKMKDPECPIISSPINYAKLNNLYDTFVPQKELTREQAYWLPANEVASNQSKPAQQFVHTRPAKKRFQELYKSKAGSNSSVSSGATILVKPKPVASGLYAMTPNNECLVFGNHDECVVKFMNAKKSKVINNANVKQVWKATGKVFASVGSRWKPTGRKFTLGDTCPLTRINKPEVVSIANFGSVRTSEPTNNVTVTPMFSEKTLTSYKRKDRNTKDNNHCSPTNIETMAA